MFWRLKLDRVNNILQNDKYKEYIKKNEFYEKDRIFCLHDMQHFLDVARIGYILSLEKGIKIKKDMIYAAAILHDIGRWKEYKDGIPHEEAGAELAKDILNECNFNQEETLMILQAIRNHRKKDNNPGTLSELLYKSDKLSRGCFQCKAKKQCKWSDEKKNLNIQY